MSLLYRGDYGIDGSNLCGKTKSPELAQEILARGELLGHETATGRGGKKERSGHTLGASVLRWHRLQDDNTYTFNLWLGNWRSKPVEVRVSQGIAVPDAVVFEMEDDPDNRPPHPTGNVPVPQGGDGQ